MPPEAALAANSVRFLPAGTWQVVSVLILGSGDQHLAPEIRFHGKPTAMDVAHETAWSIDAKTVVRDFVRKHRLTRGVCRCRVYVCEAGDAPTYGPLISSAAEVGVGYVVAPTATSEANAKLLAIAEAAGRRQNV